MVGSESVTGLMKEVALLRMMVHLVLVMLLVEKELRRLVNEEIGEYC